MRFWPGLAAGARGQGSRARGQAREPGLVGQGSWPGDRSNLPFGLAGPRSNSEPARGPSSANEGRGAFMRGWVNMTRS